MNVVNRSPGVGSIRFLTGPLAGSIYQITKPLTTIGREPDNDIIISDPSVSRQHARLVNNRGQWSIEKLAPQNLVTVNQRDVQQATISDRDTIGLGSGTTFLFSQSLPRRRSVGSNPRPRNPLRNRSHRNYLPARSARLPTFIPLATSRAFKLHPAYQRWR